MARATVEIPEATLNRVTNNILKKLRAEVKKLEKENAKLHSELEERKDRDVLASRLLAIMDDALDEFGGDFGFSRDY